MAKGEFAVRLPVESKDEFGALAARLQRHGRAPAGVVPDARRPGRREDALARGAERAARHALRHDRVPQRAQFAGEPLPRLPHAGCSRPPAPPRARCGSCRAKATRCISSSTRAWRRRSPRSEHCLQRNECACGEAAARSTATIHALGGKKQPITITLPHCLEAGFSVVAAVPVAAQRQVLGVFNLFYREPHETSSEERHMLESLGQHLGVAHREPAARLARPRARDRRGAQPARAGAARLDRAGARVPQPADADAAKALAEPDRRRDDAHPRRDPGRRAGVLRRRARAARAFPHPDRRGRRRTRRPHAARRASSTRPACAPSSASAARRCRSRPTTSCRSCTSCRRRCRTCASTRSATRVEVELKRGPDYAFVVRDDGRGFDPRARRHDADAHVGLRIMRERAARIGGTRHRAVRGPARHGSRAARSVRARAECGRDGSRRHPSGMPARDAASRTGRARSASSSSTTTRCSGAASRRCCRGFPASRSSARPPTASTASRPSRRTGPTSCCSTCTCPASPASTRCRRS